MSVITADNAQMWRDLFSEVSKEKPTVGRLVRLTRGKHFGKIGTVIKHQRDSYVNPYRYGNEASHHMTNVRGRYGFIILVQAEDETFWTKADYAMVCYE